MGLDLITENPFLSSHLLIRGSRDGGRRSFILVGIIYLFVFLLVEIGCFIFLIVSSIMRISTEPTNGSFALFIWIYVGVTASSM